MKRYDKVFREHALKLLDEIGVKKASEQFGVIYGTLADWRKQRTKQAKKPTILQSEEEQKAENERLKKENAELHKANAILRDALCFFVDDRKR